MITDLRFVEEYRLLLDDHIPAQLVHYQNVLAGLAATPSIHHHHCANRQCQVWATQLNALIADAAKLAAFQSRYPDWTTANLQAYVTSLTTIDTAVVGYLQSQNSTNLAAIQTALSANLAQVT